MNTKSIALGFAIASMLTACVMEEPFEETTNSSSAEEAGTVVSFSAVNADNPSTKTSLSDDGLSVLWNPGDAINIFYGESGSAKLTADIESPSAVTTFSGTLGEGETMTGNENIWAVYPYNEANTCDGESVTITIPNEQVAVEGSFDKNALVTVAHSSGSDLEFYNVCGGIKFRFTHGGFNKVYIYGTWAEVIAGTVKVTMDADGKPVYNVIEGKTSITATAPDEDGFKVGSWYYVAALPSDFEDGVKINFAYENVLGSMSETRTLEGHRSIKRSVWSKLTFTNEQGKPSLNQIWYKASSKVSVNMTSINSHTFSDGYGIITFSENVSSIPSNAFSDNTNLTHIYLPDGVKSIGDDAFWGCWKLTSINIPKALSSIGDNVFTFCSIQRVYITSIESWCKYPRGYFGNNPFQLYMDGTRLTDIVIPDTITEIRNGTFRGCSGLTSIEIPDGVDWIGYNAFEGCSGLTSINIPDGVTSIGGSAFQGCSGLTSIKIPDGVKTIGGSAFQGCSGLTSINIPDGVTKIASYTFEGCSGLTSIKIPDGVTIIDGFAFKDCSGLTSIKIPDGVKTIGNCAFEGCSGLTSINIPDGVTKIGSSVFSGCSGLTSINIPDGVTIIDWHTFSGCSGLTSIKIPDGVTTIGRYAFSGCSGLTSINIPDGVKSIESYTFEGCSGLTSIKIPDGVTTIESYAFSGCSNAKRLSIGAGVTEIGSQAFIDCNTLETIIISSTTPPSLGQQAFENTGTCPINVPSNSLSAYKAADGWKEYADRLAGI